jgi:hypothetical protein
MNRSIYFTFLSIGNNIVLNYYLCWYMIFPSYFKETIISLKKNSDNYYNKMMLLSFTDDIYNKYQIDLINIHKNIMKCLNENKNNNENDEDIDNISVMSDLSDFSELSND